MQTTISAQDATTGRVDVVLDRITSAFSSVPDIARVDAAVAYASVGGVQLFLSRVQRGSNWRSAKKRFLVSMDSGFTEPDALQLLSQIENAEVRVPNAGVVLLRPNLRPVRPFHPKAYLLRGGDATSPAAMISGSANLTASALSTGAEVITDQIWTSSDRRAASSYGEFAEWFEEAWDLATPLADVLREYREKRARLAARTPIPEDQGVAASAYSPSSPAVVVRGGDAARLAVGKGLWVEAGTLSKNLGRRKPGNQLDAQKGARVFFGFDAAQVPRNHIFGDIELRIGTGPYSRHSVRFGNNSMDKVNLPVPGAGGPPSYDGQFLLFEREPTSVAGIARFTLTTMSRRELRRRQQVSAVSVERSMASGRQWGVLF